MSRIDLDDPFDFVHDSSEKLVPSRPANKPRRAGRGWLVPAVGVASHMTLITLFLNFTETIQVPYLDWFTRARILQAKPPEPVPASRTTPRLVPPPIIPAKPSVTTVRPVAPWGMQTGTNPTRIIRTSMVRDQPVSRGEEPSDQIREPKFGLAEAEALLASKQITRDSASSTFILDSEAEVRNKLLSLRSKRDEYNAAHVQFSSYQNAANQIAGYRQLAIDANMMISRFNQAMSQFPPMTYRGIVIHGRNNQEDAMWRELKSQRDDATRERDEASYWRDTLNRQLPGNAMENAKKTLERESKVSRVALDEMREAVLATKREYETSGQDPEVKKALARVDQRDLCPSPSFLSHVQELWGFEWSVGRRPTLPKTEWPVSWRGGR